MPLGREVGLSPGDIVLDRDWDPAPTERGTAAPTFWPMSIVAKRSPISATAELSLCLRAMMQFIAIVDDQYARVTHFPDDNKAT